MKAEEVGALREQTLGDNREVLLDAAARAARALRRRAASCSRSATAARPPTRWTLVADFRRRRTGWPRARGDRPHRGRVDPDRDRQRHRRRGDLPAPGDRLRARGRRGARALDQRRLGRTSSRRSPRRGGAASSRSRWSATTAADRRRGPRRPRDRHPLAAHPAHPGGAGERLPRAARAGRAGSARRWPPADRGRRGPRPGHAAPSRGSASARSSSGSPPSSGSAAGC